MIGRILSATVAGAYLAAAYFGAGGETAFRVGLFLILPLACIWYGESMGAYTGTMRGQYVNAETPGCLVVAGGWLLLLLPVLFAAVRLVRARF